MPSFWSDQHPGVDVNEGPGNSGNVSDFILMSTRSNDIAYAQAHVRVEVADLSHTSSLKSRFVREIGNVFEAVGDGSISAFNGFGINNQYQALASVRVDLSLSQSTSIDEYLLVVWFDVDDNGMFACPYQKPVLIDSLDISLA